MEQLQGDVTGQGNGIQVKGVGCRFIGLSRVSLVATVWDPGDKGHPEDAPEDRGTDTSDHKDDHDDAATGGRGAQERDQA